MGDGGGGVRREFLLCYEMLIHHKLVPPHFIRFPYSVMLRLYDVEGGGGVEAP